MKTRKITALILIAAFAVMMFAGCAASADYQNATSSSAAYAVKEAPRAAGGAAMDNGFADGMYYDGDIVMTEAETAEYGPASSSSPSPLLTGKKIIKNAYMYMQTTEFDNTVSALNSLVSELGGYIENSDISGGYIGESRSSRELSYTVRVPADKYSAFIGRVGDVAHIVNINESISDVSEEYFDIEGRLSTLRAKQKRLQELLEKAERIEDMITIENALSDVTYEIESYASRLKRLDSQIDYSQIYINLSEVYKLTEVEKTPETFGERISGALSRGIRRFGDNLEDLAVDLVYALPWLIVLAVIIIIAVIIASIVRRSNKKKRQRAQEQYMQQMQQAQQARPDGNNPQQNG